MKRIVTITLAVFICLLLCSCERRNSDYETSNMQEKNWAIGDTVLFGTYPQTETGTDMTPIEWIVLNRDGNKALLISKYGLDVKPYNEIDADVTWESCSLRKWLNEEFFLSAFSEKERKSVVLTLNENPADESFGSKGGNATKDNVFLFHYEEVFQYFDKDEDRVAIATKYVEAKTNGRLRGACTWGLRTAVSFMNYAGIVKANGAVTLMPVNEVNVCVRPCVWIEHR